MSLNPTGGRVLIAGAVMSLLIAACGSSATPAPSAAPTGKSPFATPVTAQTPGAQTPAPTTAGQTPAAETPAAETPAPTAQGGSGDPIGALANLTSYKIKMVIDSTNVSGGLGSMGAIKMEGTVILKPAPAADIKMSIGSGAAAMTIRIVEINGKSYIDAGTGSLVESTGSQSSLVDSLSPAKLFGSFGSYTNQMQVVGDETKNGIPATHLTATQALLDTAGSALGGAFGLADGKWSMDVWVAKDGGYAVSYVVKGTGTTSGAASDITISLDLSNVDDPANTVKGP